MPQIEVLREHWKTFCLQFTRQHQVWIFNLSVGEFGVGAELKAEEAERRMRPLVRWGIFQGITVDPHDGGCTISIVAGMTPGQVIHSICDPLHLFFRQTKEGAHEGLVIESVSGQTTLLRFRTAALPETLDGISEAELLAASRLTV